MSMRASDRLVVWVLLGALGGPAVASAAPSSPASEKLKSLGLETPPGTFELDVIVGGAMSWVGPDEAPSRTTASLLVRPGGGYFLTRSLVLRAVLLYAADFASDGPDAHQLEPSIGLSWLFRPGEVIRPYLGLLGDVGVRILGGNAGLGYGLDLDAGLLVAFTPRVASEIGVSFRLRRFHNPDVFSIIAPFGNLGILILFP